MLAIEGYTVKSVLELQTVHFNGAEQEESRPETIGLSVRTPCTSLTVF